ncbi:MAG: hypothetical protein PHE49_06835 [bacterium]|nr:hypothetical protein [bacterium]
MHNKKGRCKASKGKGSKWKNGGFILLFNLISLAEIIKTCNKKGGVK